MYFCRFFSIEGRVGHSVCVERRHLKVFSIGFYICRFLLRLSPKICVEVVYVHYGCGQAERCRPVSPSVHARSFKRSVLPETRRMSIIRNPFHATPRAQSMSGLSYQRIIKALWERHLGSHPHPTHRTSPHQHGFVPLDRGKGRAFPETVWHHYPADKRYKGGTKTDALYF